MSRYERDRDHRLGRSRGGLATKIHVVVDARESRGAMPNIPPRSNRRWKPCFTKRLDRERNLIGRFFSKLKHFRRVATRCDKPAANFLGMIQLASVRLRLSA